jgi:protein prenyltransferase alpha subunit repeat containing protein 1
MACDRLIVAWSTNAIDELDFVHMDDVAVFEGSKLAVPYSLLVDIASSASQRLSKVLASSITAETTHEALQCSLACLTVNGNNYAAWNVRKTATALLTPVDWQSELATTAALLSKHSKSACGWSHRWVKSFLSVSFQPSLLHTLSLPPTIDMPWFRRWVLQQLLATTSPEVPTLADFEREWQLCELAAERYPKNYYAWSHRVWLWQTHGHNRLALAQADLDRTRVWTASHLSDYSGYHHEFVMTTALMDGGCSPHDMMAEVQGRVVYYQQQVQDYPDHEAVQQHLIRLTTLLQQLTLQLDMP